MIQEPRWAKWSTKQWGLLFLALLVTPLVAGWVGSSLGEAGGQHSATAQAPVFKAVASSQSAQGVTQERMDQPFLASYEQYTAEHQMANTRRELEARGDTTPVPRPTSSSEYILAGGHRIAVVRTLLSGEGANVHSVHLMAVFGDEVRRVICISTQGEVAIFDGPCATKIEETFGFRL